MATPNYGYEKRQRELAKKKKKEEKLLAKSQRKTDEPNPGQESPDDAPTSDGGHDGAAAPRSDSQA